MFETTAIKKPTIWSLGLEKRFILMTNLRKYFTECPTCRQVFYILSPSRAELRATLGSKTISFVYCKEKCLTVRLENMNQNKPPLYPDVKIKSQNVILATAESPIIYEIEFVEDYKELENIIHGK